jgi:hypothetical protein
MVKKTVPINRVKLDQTKRLFRAWISPSIDLSRAKKKERKLYFRTTYIQEVKKEKLRLPTERWLSPKGGLQKPVKDLAQLSAQTKLQLSIPVKTLYREGLTYFKFQKIKEMRAETRLKESDAVRLAKDFLLENGFLTQTQKDSIGRIDITDRRINEDRGEGRKPDDYLVQQDIVFHRVFEGKPVINSKITVGLLPDTKEIVLIKHFNWTPLEEKKKAPVSSQRLASVRSVSGSSILKGLKKKIRASCGNFTKAEIMRVTPAWFQTEDELIPVMVSAVRTKYPSGYVGAYTDVTNLVGSDDIFFKGRKGALPDPMPKPEDLKSLPGDPMPKPEGSKEDFCRQYAEGALRQISERIERTGPAPANDPVWKKDFNHHYNWCLLVPESLADRGSKQRQDWLAQHMQRGALPDPMPEPKENKKGALPDPMPKPVDSKSLPGDPAPSGAHNDFCSQYADRALQQISERIERTGPVPANDPVWKKDFNHHYNWCLLVPESLAHKGSKQRQDWLAQHVQTRQDTSGGGISKVTMEFNTNRPGQDYKNFELDTPDPGLCQKACADDPNCQSYTYVKPGIQGAKARCWLKKAVPLARSNNCCVSGVKTAQTDKPKTPQGGGSWGISPSVSLEPDTNRPGKDYKNFELDTPDPGLCQKACADDPNCQSYTYVKPGIQGAKARCWLKKAVPPARSNNCCISGVKK